MDAKVCDRCGKVCNIPDQQYVVKELNALGNKTIRIEIEYANAYQTRKEIDLCTNCKKTLLNWLEGISSWSYL